MLKRSIAISVLAGAFAFSAGPLLAADQDRERIRDQMQEQDQERVYGSQLMTQQERDEYRTRMRAAKTAEEREQIRAEHHERMKVRAKERGVTLPDDPPARGGMMGPGGGMGGMGSGGGMGPGGGMGGRQGGGR